MRQQGSTIVELMIATVALGSLFATMASTGAWLHRSEQAAAAYADDVRQCRRALSHLECDLRAAQHVEHDGAILRVLQPEATIVYELQAGVLTRKTAGRATVVGRRIGALRAALDGRLVKVQLALRPRATNPGREATVDTAIYLRNGGN